MASTYSVDQLLDMRLTLPILICDLKKINPRVSPDLICLPEKARLEMKKIRLSSKDSTYDSKDSGNSYSGSLYHTTSRLRAGTLRTSDNVGGYDDGSGDGEELVYNGDPAYRDIQNGWKLHRRRFEDGSSQPFSAPSGDEAQRAENFKKFYEAVVSPTHVRVTAGGRIVPNLRGVPHCSAYWDSERFCFEEIPPSPLEPQGSWLQGTSLAQKDTGSPLTVAMAPDYSFFGPPLASRDATASTSAAINQNMRLAASEQNFNVDTKDLPNEGRYTAPAHGEIKISPPSQFDSSKPFICNGQLLYPLPAGYHVPPHMPVFPVSMLGNSNIAHPFIPQQGTTLPAPIQFSPPPMPPGQVITQHGTILQIPGIHSVGMQQMHSMHQHGPGFSMPSQTPLQKPPNPYFQLQFQDLQNQLKHIDNQLQNNKHQIDEPYVRAQQACVQSQIVALQSVIGAQGPQPSSSPEIQAEPDAVQNSFSSKRNSELGMLHLPITEESVTWELPGNSTQPSQKKPVKGCASQCAGQGTSPPRKGDPTGTAGMPFIAESKATSSPAPCELSSRTRLRAAAASALPFQPRSQQPVILQASAVGSKSATENTIEFTKETTNLGNSPLNPGAPLLSAVSTWKAPSQLAIPAAMPTPLPLPKAQTMYSPIPTGNFYRPPVTLQKYNTFQCPVPVPFEHIAGSAFKPATPYLLGFPPSGMSVERAKSSDLLYSRELTEDEIRARKLYWGNAPREATKGLPKFDGRDFYPPSPVKRTVMPVVAGSGNHSTSSRTQHSSNKLTQRKLSKSEHMVEPSVSQIRTCSLSENLLNVNSAELNFSESGTNPLRTAPYLDVSPMDSWEHSKPNHNDTLQVVKINSPHSKDSDSTVTRGGGQGFNYPPLRRKSNLKSAHTSILQGMLDNSPGTPMAAATGALSSAMAHGHLPQYGGSAAASLAPSINNASATPKSKSLIDKANIHRMAAPVRTENRPPSRLPSEDEPLSAADLLRKFNRPMQEISDPSFDPNTTGVGPVYGGSDW